MAWRVNEICPQCGATVTLEETDHLLSCPYCGVRHAVCAPSMPGYILVHRTGAGQVFYLPYLRFKGTVYACGADNISSRVVDLSIRTIPLAGAPLSLGLRVQGTPMAFAPETPPGVYLDCTPDIKGILERAFKTAPGEQPVKAFYRAVIGEVISIIYLPLLLERETLKDGVSGKELGRIKDGPGFFEPWLKKESPCPPRLVAAICPNCGWDLEGEGISTVFVCTRCMKGWEIDLSGLKQTVCRFVPCSGNSAMFLPFWRMEVHISVPGIQDEELRRMGTSVVWCPAFKIRPDVFLYLAGRLTASGRDFSTEEGMENACTFPVTLAGKEALESVKLIVYKCSQRKSSLAPLLSIINVVSSKMELFYLPFDTSGYELVCQCLPLTINKKALFFSRSL